jgi:hypothetical protein
MTRTRKVRSENQRRSVRRFPIEQEVAYKCTRGRRVSEMGVGRTVEISTLEVTFTTQRPLRTNQRAEVAVNWPAMIDSTCHMKLVIRGRVVHGDAHCATVTIERYEFRTRSANPLLVLPAPEARDGKGGLKVRTA